MSDNLAPPDALTRLAEQLAGPMDSVNRLIIEKMQSPVALIPQLASVPLCAGSNSRLQLSGSGPP